MEKFEIEIIETLSRTISVEANSLDSALEIVKETYSKQGIVLGYGDYKCTEFELVR